LNKCETDKDFNLSFNKIRLGVHSMRRLTLIVIALLLVGILLVGCNSAGGKELSIEEGFVLDIGDDVILIAKDISAEEFIEIDDKFVSGDPALDFDGPDEVALVYIINENIDGIKKGDKVKAWVDGVGDSYPQLAKAEKISVQN